MPKKVWTRALSFSRCCSSSIPTIMVKRSWSEEDAEKYNDRFWKMAKILQTESEYLLNRFKFLLKRVEQIPGEKKSGVDGRIMKFISNRQAESCKQRILPPNLIASHDGIIKSVGKGKKINLIYWIFAAHRARWRKASSVSRTFQQSIWH